MGSENTMQYGHIGKQRTYFKKYRALQKAAKEAQLSDTEVLQQEEEKY